MEDDETSSDDDSKMVFGPVTIATRTLCSHALSMPATLLDLKDMYVQYGFFDTSTHDGMIDAVLPFIRMRKTASADQELLNY
jgi:hypothetical protein